MKHQESDEQQALFEWAEYHSTQYPELKLMYHIPNGGKRNIREAARLKREGVKAGVPDIFLPVARRGFHGLYIEMKAGKGKATKSQNEWSEALMRQGYCVLIRYDWEHASSSVLDYLGVA